MTVVAPIAFTPRGALFGATLALPALAVTLFDPARGLPLAVGVLPAVALGLRSSRRERAAVLIVGAVAGASMLLGSLVAGLPALAVAMVFVLCVVVAVSVANPSRRLAPLVMMLGLPLYGAGLSETPAAGAGAALLMIVGSGYAWVVSLLWPVQDPGPRRPRSATTRGAMLRYGIQIGLAGAAAAALGFAFGADHPGWACTAALLVSRPDRRALDARSWQRSLAVLAGAMIACAVAAFDPQPWAPAVLAAAALTGAGATVGSRWYVLPFFSTTIVLTMLLLDETTPAAHWFLERVGLTIAGVVLALLAAWLVPVVAARVAPRHLPSR